MSPFLTLGTENIFIIVFYLEVTNTTGKFRDFIGFVVEKCSVVVLDTFFDKIQRICHIKERGE